MDHAAPAIFQALEQSGLAAAIRQSVWLYPLANVGHVLAVVVFAGAVAVMDVRLLGAFSGSPAAAVLRGGRRAALAAFLAIALTGSMLFMAEASHLVLNPVFLTKLGLIALGLVNVAAFELALAPRVVGLPAGAPLPSAVRRSAMLSVGLWLLVAGLGRSIAYF
jgi:hypothetical protein